MKKILSLVMCFTLLAGAIGIIPKSDAKAYNTSLQINRSYTFSMMRNTDIVVENEYGNDTFTIDIPKAGSYTFIRKSYSKSDNTAIELNDPSGSRLLGTTYSITDIYSRSDTLQLDEGTYEIVLNLTDQSYGVIALLDSSHTYAEPLFDERETITDNSVKSLTVASKDAGSAPRLALNQTYTIDFKGARNANLSLTEAYSGEYYYKVLVLENGDYTFTANFNADCYTNIELLDSDFVELRGRSTYKKATYSETLRLARGVYFFKILGMDQTDAAVCLSKVGTTLATQVINVSPKAQKKVVYTEKAINKKARKFNIKATAMGAISYKVVGKSPFIKVSPAGKVTVAKGTPKGIYKVKVTAAATDEYEKATKTIKIQIK